MNPEINPEKRRYTKDKLQNLARLYLPRVILGALLGAAIGGAAVWFTGMQQSVLDQRIITQPAQPNPGQGQIDLERTLGINYLIIDHSGKIILFTTLVGATTGALAAKFVPPVI